MQIAIASGKGGTGKTTVATNLAYVASRSGQSVVYLDCDVEEPNGHIVLKPAITDRKPVGSLIPQVDAKSCTLCGECGEICQFSAIVCLGEKVRKDRQNEDYAMSVISSAHGRPCRFLGRCNELAIFEVDRSRATRESVGQVGFQAGCRPRQENGPFKPKFYRHRVHRGHATLSAGHSLLRTGCCL